MYFKEVVPHSDPQIKEVIVSVVSNLGRPYLVSQNMSGTLTNEKGIDIKRQAFLIKGEFTEKAIGRIQYPAFEPVPDGEKPLYFSDDSGSPAEFKIMYQLKPFDGMRPGDYQADVIYSLGEL